MQHYSNMPQQYLWNQQQQEVPSQWSQQSPYLPNDGNRGFNGYQQPHSQRPDDSELHSYSHVPPYFSSKLPSMPTDYGRTGQNGFPSARSGPLPTFSINSGPVPGTTRIHRLGSACQSSGDVGRNTEQRFQREFTEEATEVDGSDLGSSCSSFGELHNPQAGEDVPAKSNLWQKMVRKRQSKGHTEDLGRVSHDDEELSKDLARLRVNGVGHDDRAHRGCRLMNGSQNSARVSDLERRRNEVGGVAHRTGEAAHCHQHRAPLAAETGNGHHTAESHYGGGIGSGLSPVSTLDSEGHSSIHMPSSATRPAAPLAGVTAADTTNSAWQIHYLQNTIPADHMEAVPLQSGLAGLWRKNLDDSDTGAVFDELLDMPKLQRLARQRMQSLEIKETEEEFEIVWHVRLNGGREILKSEKYPKDGTITESARRDGREAHQRGFIAFKEGVLNIRCVQGDPYAALFHDRVKLSSRGNRLRIEHKLQLLLEGVQPVRYTTLWNRTHDYSSHASSPSYHGQGVSESF